MCMTILIFALHHYGVSFEGDIRVCDRILYFENCFNQHLLLSPNQNLKMN